MSWGVYQVEYVVFPFVRVLHLYRVALDGYAAFAFQVHVVQQLVLAFAFGYGAGVFEQTVRQGAFAVVDMGDDTEIAYVLHINMFRDFDGFARAQGRPGLQR